MPDTSSAAPARMRSIMYAWAQTHDVALLCENATFVFTAMPEPARGREQIAAALRFFFHDAFDASTEIRSVGFDPEQALGCIDFIFRGRHIGEFLGRPPTGKSVELPMAGIYHLEQTGIRRAHVYFDSAALAAQLDLA